MYRKSDHEEVYEKLSSLFKIKFKAQLKDSPIEFLKFLHIKNLITNNEDYCIFLKNEKNCLIFKNKSEFIKCFLNHIQIKITELQNEFEELSKFESMNSGIKYDRNEVYIRHEIICDEEYKLEKLKEKLIKINEQNL